MAAPEKFSDLFDLFTALRSGYLRKTTVRDTFIPTRKAVVRGMGDPIAKDVTALDLLTFVQRLLSTRKANGVNVNIRILRVFGRWSADNGILPEGNPFAKLKTLRVADTPIRFLSREEFRRISNTEKSLELRKVYVWGLLTGLRAGDLLRLRREDIDRRTPAGIRVTNSKSGRVATIPLHPALNALLDDMPVGEGGSLWSRGFTVSYVSHRFKRAARGAGVPDVSLHTLRKTFGSWLAKNGVNIFEIQKLLMHSSPLLTAKYYAHLQPSDLGRYVERLVAATGSIPIKIADDPYANAAKGVNSALLMDYTSSTKRN